MQIVFVILAIALPAYLVYIAIGMLSKPSAQEQIQFAILKEECDTSRQAKILHGGHCEYRILLKNVITDAEIETISQHIKKKAPSVKMISIKYVLPCMEYAHANMGWRFVNFDPEYRKGVLDDTSAVFYNILEPVKFGTQSWAVYRDKSDPVYQCMKDNKHIYKEMVEGFIDVKEEHYQYEHNRQEIRKYGWNKIKPILEEIAS